MSTAEQSVSNSEAFSAPQSPFEPIEHVEARLAAFLDQLPDGRAETVEELAALRAQTEGLIPVPIATDGSEQETRYLDIGAGAALSRELGERLAASADAESYILPTDEFLGHEQVSSGDFMRGNLSEDAANARVVSDARNRVRELVAAGLPEPDAIQQVADKSRQRIGLSDYAADPEFYTERASAVQAETAAESVEAAPARTYYKQPQADSRKGRKLAAENGKTSVSEVVTAEPQSLAPEDEAAGMHELKPITTGFLNEVNQALKSKAPTIDELDALEDFDDRVRGSAETGYIDEETGEVIDTETAQEFEHLADPKTWLLSQEAAERQRAMAKFDELTPLRELLEVAGTKAVVDMSARFPGMSDMDMGLRMAEEARAALRLDAALRERGWDESAIQSYEAYAAELEAAGDEEDIATVEPVTASVSVVEVVPAGQAELARSARVVRRGHTMTENGVDPYTEQDKAGINAPVIIPIAPGPWAEASKVIATPAAAEAAEDGDASRAAGAMAWARRQLAGIRAEAAEKGVIAAAKDRAVSLGRFAFSQAVSYNETLESKSRIRMVLGGMAGVLAAGAAIQIMRNGGEAPQLPLSFGGSAPDATELAAAVPENQIPNAVQPEVPQSVEAAQQPRPTATLEVYSSRTGAGTVEGAVIEQVQGMDADLSGLTANERADVINEARQRTLQLNGWTEAEARRLQVGQIIELMRREELEEIIKAAKKK